MNWVVFWIGLLLLGSDDTVTQFLGAWLILASFLLF